MNATHFSSTRLRMPAVLVLTVGCYGSAPPRPTLVPLPALDHDAQISVSTESNTRYETVQKKSHSCPQGHAPGSQACVVHRYSVKEPVTRTHSTATYGSAELNYAQFQVMTDPEYDNKLATLADHSAACRGANLPRWLGAGLAIAGAAVWTIGASSRAARISGLALLGGGTGSYITGYYWFGGRRCGEAKNMYRDLEFGNDIDRTLVSGSGRAEHMKALAEEFNRNATQAARR